LPEILFLSDFFGLKKRSKKEKKRLDGILRVNIVISNPSRRRRVWVSDSGAAAGGAIPGPSGGASRGRGAGGLWGFVQGDFRAVNVAEGLGEPHAGDYFFPVFGLLMSPVSVPEYSRFSFGGSGVFLYGQGGELFLIPTPGFAWQARRFSVFSSGRRRLFFFFPRGRAVEDAANTLITWPGRCPATHAR
jgi:hypothetical protein